MKKSNVVLAFIVFLSSFTIISCEDNLIPKHEESILPKNFKVDIPDAISQKAAQLKSAGADTIQGNNIYEHLNTFIWIGEGAADIVEEIIFTIAVYGINKPMSLSYTSDEDNRVKNLVVKDDVLYESKMWNHELTITDALSESNPDGGIAIQVFWNKDMGDGIEGIALLKPFNINKLDDENTEDAILRIDYSELGENGYDAQMIVQIAGLPLADPLIDPYSINSLKMFAGRKGDIVDVYGNTNHPNAKFFNGNTGFNWAFVASGNDKKDIGVAEVGLPPSTLDATTRSVILEQYSIKQVLTDQIYDVWPNADSKTVEAFLHNTGAPGFFNSGGFIQGGTAPSDEYDALIEQIKKLTPYNPKEVSLLTINFK